MTLNEDDISEILVGIVQSDTMLNRIRVIPTRDTEHLSFNPVMGKEVINLQPYGQFIADVRIKDEIINGWAPEERKKMLKDLFIDRLSVDLEEILLMSRKCEEGCTPDTLSLVDGVLALIPQEVEAESLYADHVQEGQSVFVQNNAHWGDDDSLDKTLFMPERQVLITHPRNLIMAICKDIKFTYSLVEGEHIFSLWINLSVGVEDIEQAKNFFLVEDLE